MQPSVLASAVPDMVAAQLEAWLEALQQERLACVQAQPEVSRRGQLAFAQIRLAAQQALGLSFVDEIFLH